MHTNILPGNTQAVMDKISSIASIKDFYLSGGTALALQIGHRESQDLDFFTQTDLNPEELVKQLEVLGQLESVETTKGTLNCFINQVKLQFLSYPYPLLEEKILWEHIFISSQLDIACTKLITISSRGGKKDFIDLYFLLQKYSLDFLFKKLIQKYSQTKYNEIHILKSLTYFVDADNEPMPRMHTQISWDDVKQAMVRQAKSFKI